MRRGQFIGSWILAGVVTHRSMVDVARGRKLKSAVDLCARGYRKVERQPAGLKNKYKVTYGVGADEECVWTNDKPGDGKGNPPSVMKKKLRMLFHEPRILRGLKMLRQGVEKHAAGELDDEGLKKLCNELRLVMERKNARRVVRIVFQKQDKMVDGMDDGEKKTQEQKILESLRKAKDYLNWKSKRWFKRKATATMDNNQVATDLTVSHIASRVAASFRVALQFDTRKEFEQYRKEHEMSPSTQVVIKEEQKGSGETKESVEPKPSESKQPAKEDVADKPKPQDKTPADQPPPFFSKEEMDLPSQAKQKDTDEESLFATAEKAQEHMLDWLDRGTGVDKEIGAKIVSPDDEAVLDAPGPILMTAPLKSRKRSREKVETEKGGDWSQLTDVVRATIAVDTVDDLHNTLDVLRKKGMKLAKKPTDRFSRPTDAGYRDMLLNVELPNGHIGELQLHVKPILKAKAKAHKMYEAARTIAAQAQKEGRTTMTDEETKTVQRLNDEMKRVYSDAWEQSTRKRKSSMITAAKTSYYRFRNMAAKWELGKFPVLVLPNGKEKVVYDLFTFFTHVETISQKEFNEMVGENKQ